MRMTRRILSALCAATLLASVGASAVFAGEITGNGRSLKVDGGGKWATGLHARSFCAFSGQEDDQFLLGNSKGVPAHAQSWGQIPNFIRADIPAAFHPGMACNPNIGPPPEG
jgi:hypothetical protein